MPQSSVLTISDELLRNRGAFVARIESGEATALTAKTLLITILLSGAIFGGVVGANRGGLQILYAAIKIPFVVLITAALVTPVFSTVRIAIDGKTDLRRDTLLILASLALGSLVLVALSPVVLLCMKLEMSYHNLALVTVFCCAIGGLAGVGVFLRGLKAREGTGKGWVFVAVAAAFLVVGAQASWTLRPYLLRPRTPDVVFVRALEGSFIESVETSLNSARGRYTRDYAPLPADVGPLRTRLSEPQTLGEARP
ncbi:MAG: hypothetical protein HYY84_09515 [Deltaproteobacteria bacterium]|nr:hypothetical protein [Deltaproteobacteria bacterium]